MQILAAFNNVEDFLIQEQIRLKYQLKHHINQSQVDSTPFVKKFTY